MKLNSDILVCGTKHETMIGSVENSKIIESQKVKLLSIEIDRICDFTIIIF